MKKKLLILIIVLSLLGIGIFTMFSLSSRESLTLTERLVKEGWQSKVTEIFYFTRYTKSVIIGLIFGIGFFLIPRRYLTNPRFSIIFFLTTLILILLSLFNGIGITLNGEMGWMYLFGIGLGPIYFYIIGSILLLASFLSSGTPIIKYIKMKTKRLSFKLNLPSFFTRLPLFVKYLIIQILISVPVILVKDLSNLFLLWAIGTVVFCFSKQIGKIKYLLFVLALFIVGLVSTAFTSRYEHIFVSTSQCSLFSNSKSENPACHNYSKIQLALKRGGLIGVGHGNGRLNRETFDTISYLNFAGIGEEFGKLGLLFLVGLYSLLFRAIFRGIKKDEDNRRLICIGLGSYILLTTLFHILVNIGFLPFVGFGLAFISYGSSQLIARIITIGIIMKMKYNNQNNQ